MSKRVAGLAFTGKDQKIRNAQAVFENYSRRPDPDNPTKKMRPQTILTEALLALGEKAGLLEGYTGIPAQDIDKVIMAIELLHQNIEALISTQYQAIETQIQKLVESGVITHTQAQKVSQIIDDETRQFSANMSQSLRGGKRS